MKQYNETADIFKGVLILLVIIGHAVKGGMLENPIRYFIYSFHMPVFLFIGGYLVNMDKLRQLSWIDIWKKYWNRMILSWAIAWLAYTLFNNYQQLSVKLFISNLVHPFYHLWYIPSFFIMICIAVLFQKKGISIWVLMLLGIFTMLAQCLRDMPSSCKLWPMIYFAAGIYMKECSCKRSELLIKHKWGG